MLEQIPENRGSCQCLHVYDPRALHGLSFLNIYIYNTRVKNIFPAWFRGLL